jgi:Restriction endonuclease
MQTNTGIPYELVVQSIFQEILDQEGAHTIRVEHNVELKGRTTTHQIDVLWRFSIGGITYTTLVQAKDLKSKIKKETVLAFRAVLDDIPEQPRGVLVTSSGFQSGAKSLAERHGIKLYLLRPLLPEFTTTTLGYVKVSLDLHERVLRAIIFDPEVRTKFFLADPPTPTRSPIPKVYYPRNLQLLGDDGTPLGTVQDVLKAFVEEMRKTGTLSGSFNRDFPVPTYLRPSRRSRQLHRLVSITAEIEIVPHPQPPIPFRSSGIVHFILEDLHNGERHTYRRRSQGKGT